MCSQQMVTKSLKRITISDFENSHTARRSVMFNASPSPQSPVMGENMVSCKEYFEMLDVILDGHSYFTAKPLSIKYSLFMYQVFMVSHKSQDTDEGQVAKNMW